MTHASSAEADSTHIQHQLDELTQVRTLDAGIALCFELLQNLFQPRAAQLIWYRDGVPQLLDSKPATPMRVPPPTLMPWLETGELAFDVAEGRTMAVYAPLRVRGELVGWMYLDQPVWHSENVAQLSVLVAQAAPTLALLEAEARHAERVTQLHTLTEIGRVISSVLDLESLLDAIYHTTCQLVDVSDFYIGLYDAALDRLEFAYLVRAGQRVYSNAHWRPTDGLTSALITKRSPIYTDDYISECVRQGIVPITINDEGFDHAWLGVPLFAHDRLVGIMNVSSQRPGYTYTPDQVDLIITIGAQAAIAIENARLYQRSERQTRQLATLNRIGRTITSSLDPTRVPSLIMEQVCDLLDVEEGSLLLMDDDSGDLVFTYTNGPVGNELLGHRVPRGAGIAGYVASSGEAVVVNDVQSDRRFYADTDSSTGFTTRSLMAVPLQGVGGVQGVIEVLNKRDAGSFTGDDRQLLEAIADQAVIALENAKQFAQVDQALARRATELARSNDRLQHNLRSLTALNALGMAFSTSFLSAEEIFSMTARGALEITNALGAAVLVLDGDRFHTAVQIGPALPLLDIEPLLRHTCAVKRPEVIHHEGTTIHTLFAVPLLTTTQTVLGALCMYYADTLPDVSDQETVVLFATQAAAAVGSLELFTAVREARDEMASILASTRDGVMLIAPTAQIAIANDALKRLCGFDPSQLEHVSTRSFLEVWERVTEYPPDAWATLRRGLDAVVHTREQFAFGELDALNSAARSLEWMALPVNASGESQGGALLVLRDITEAKDAERLRQDLTNMIVHDLRSPLSSVMAAIDLLGKGISGEINLTQRSVLNIAYTSSVQMLDMINTLLDISRLEDGHMPLTCKPTALSEQIERAVERLTSLANDRAITVARAVPADVPLVFADSELIVRVVQNLLGNALKFSSRGSSVEISVSVLPPIDDTPPQVRVAVCDHGVGIAPKDQEKVFAKFGQVGERRGGTGLGLTFCKLVIEAQSGTIWVESAPGQGSTFFFTLPQA